MLCSIGGIEGQALENHVLIDVANYHHVPNGPGTVLIANEANISLDFADGRLGRHCRKRTLPAAVLFADCLRGSAQTFKIADLLQAEERFGGNSNFDSGNLLIRINWSPASSQFRLHLSAASAQIQMILNDLLGTAVLTPTQNPFSVFEIRVQSAGVTV